MEVDPDDIFKDDEDDADSESYQRNESTKEFVVYLVDASPKMFSSTCPSDDGKKEENHFHVAVSCIAQTLRTQIINRSYDEVAICFFNTREKKNLQDLNSVFVFNVAERESLDRPTARLIKDFDSIEETFMKEIGSQNGIVSESRENSLYNGLWAAQAILRKGSAKTADKRILLLTNEGDPFGDIKDLGISIELLPLSRLDEEFNVSIFYADLIGLEGEDRAQFMLTAGQKLDDMKYQLRKRIITKRIVRRITLSVVTGLSIEVNTYALIRPTLPGAITWLDSVTNRPLKTERSFICADTGALMQEPSKRYQNYKQENIKFSEDELSEIKRVSSGHLRLLGFKPLSCLKDYHNLRPSTFIFPSDKEVVGSTCIFIALHRSMLRLQRFAVAFYGSTSNPHLVALVAQDEIVSAAGQVEPPGMNMIYLPYSDDIRDIEEIVSNRDRGAPRATGDQIKMAAALIKRVDLKDFSVCQFANPALQRHYAVLQALALDEDEMPEINDETLPDEEGMTLQRHYAVLQALALDEDEMPEINDETLPDEEGMSRPGVVRVVEEFKLSVYGDKYDEENDLVSDGKPSETSKKRKAATENAAKESANYNWGYLADNGQLKDLTVGELKLYLTAHSLPVTGKKDILVSRILTHLGK